MHGHLGGVGKLLKSRPSGTENNSMGQIKEKFKERFQGCHEGLKRAKCGTMCCVLIRDGRLLSNFNKMVT